MRTIFILNLHKERSHTRSCAKRFKSRKVVKPLIKPFHNCDTSCCLAAENPSRSIQELPAGRLTLSMLRCRRRFLRLTSKMVTSDQACSFNRASQDKTGHCLVMYDSMTEHGYSLITKFNLFR